MLHSGSPFSVFFRNIQTAFGETHMTGAGILLLLFCLLPFIMERRSGGKWGKMSRFSMKIPRGGSTRDRRIYAHARCQGTAGGTLPSAG